jgi:hypothetical protein
MWTGVCPRCGASDEPDHSGGILEIREGRLLMRSLGFHQEVTCAGVICWRCGYVVLQVEAEDLEALRIGLQRDGDHGQPGAQQDE